MKKFIVPIKAGFGREGKRVGGFSPPHHSVNSACWTAPAKCGGGGAFAGPGCTEPASGLVRTTTVSRLCRASLATALMPALQNGHHSEGTGMNYKLNNIQNWPELARRANWSVGKMAESCGVSARTLRRHFLKTLGMTPKLWLTDSARTGQWIDTQGLLGQGNGGTSWLPPFLNLLPRIQEALWQMPFQGCTIINWQSIPRFECPIKL